MAADPARSLDLETVRVRAYERALEQARETPDGYLGAAEALRIWRVGFKELHAAAAAGRIRTTRYAGNLRAYQREDVEALARDASVSD
jgi:hypothetical protein